MLLHALARPGSPAVLVVEDLQWATPSRSPSSSTSPTTSQESAVTVVVTLRTGTDTWAAHSGPRLARRAADGVVLQPLDRDQILAMAREIVGGAAACGGGGHAASAQRGRAVPRRGAARGRGTEGVVRDRRRRSRDRSLHLSRVGWNTPTGGGAAPATRRDARARLRLDRRGPRCGVDEHAAAELLRRLCARTARRRRRRRLSIPPRPDARCRAASGRSGRAEDRRGGSARRARSARPAPRGSDAKPAATLAAAPGNSRAADLLLVAPHASVDQGALESAEALLRRADDIATAEHRFPIDSLLLRISALSGQVDRASALGERLLDRWGARPTRLTSASRSAARRAHRVVGLSPSSTPAIAALVPDDDAPDRPARPPSPLSRRWTRRRPRRFRSPSSPSRRDGHSPTGRAVRSPRSDRASETSARHRRGPRQRSRRRSA